MSTSITLDKYHLELTNTYSAYSGHAFGETFVLKTQATIQTTSRYLYRNGTRTGNLTANIYTITGTYGTNSVPNTLLATSDTVVANGLNNSAPGPYTVFTFSGANLITLNPGYYYMTIESSTSDYGFHTNAPQNQSDAVGDSAYLSAGTWTRDTPGYAFGIFGTINDSPFPSFLQQ